MSKRYYCYYLDTCDDDDTFKCSELQLLYDICFQYCDAFSLVFFTCYEGDDILKEYNKSSVFLQFSKLAKKVVVSNEWPGTNLCDQQSAVIMFFQYDAQTKYFLESLADNILNFEGLLESGMPEDLAFYRADGTVMFYSTIHEGIFHINADKNEDIIDILSLLKWKECEPGYYDTKKWF